MNLAQSPITYDSKDPPYTFSKETVVRTTMPTPSLVRVPDPTFYPYRDGGGNTRLTAPSLYPAEGIGDAGIVVVHEDVLAPLERARARVREAGFELAVVSGFSTPKREQRKFVEVFTRLCELAREKSRGVLKTADEVRMGRLAASVGTPAMLATTKHQTKFRRIVDETMRENFSGLGGDTLHLVHELIQYRGNVRPYSDRYTESICPPIVYAAVSDENFGRTVQCVLTSLDNPERALNMGIGVDIPYPSLDAPKAFEDMDLSRLLFLVKDNPLAREYFMECLEPPNQATLDNIITRRRVLYHAMTEEGFARGKRQGTFVLPAERKDLPTDQYMLQQGRAFGHTW